MTYCPPILTLTQTVAPAKEPITLPEAKEQVRVDINDTAYDTDLAAFIAAARNAAEGYLNRQLITGTYTMTFEDFPSLRGPVSIPRPPVQSITSIAYIDGAGASQTLASSSYKLVIGSAGGYVIPDYQLEWPDIYNHELAENVTVTFVAGYGDDPSDVPETIRQAIRLLVADLFENREMQNAGSALTENRTAKMLLNLHRAVPVA